MMKKTVLAILFTTCMAVTACGGNNQKTEPETSMPAKADIESSEQEKIESSTSKKSGKKKYEHEEWMHIGYWKGTEGINLDALWEVAGEFVQFDIYQASHMTEEYTGTGTFMWMDFIYSQKGPGQISNLKFPDNIEEVPEDWKTNFLAFYDGTLSSSNAFDFFSSNDLTFNIESLEKVTINGKDFMKEVAMVEAREKDGFIDGVRTGKYVAYYYSDENGSGVVIAGDKSDNQDMFHRVEEVTDAIMQSYNPDITGLRKFGQPQ